MGEGGKRRHFILNYILGMLNNEDVIWNEPIHDGQAFWVYPIWPQADNKNFEKYDAMSYTLCNTMWIITLNYCIKVCYCIKFCLQRQKNLLPILAPTEKNWQLFIHNTAMHMNNLYCQFIEHANSTYLENMIHNVYWSVSHILLEIFATEVLKINLLSNQPFTLKSRPSQTQINAYLRHSPIAEPIIIKLYL